MSDKVFEIVDNKDLDKVGKLFEGWQETLIYSCLQKVMGKVYTDSVDNPRSAMCYVGVFGLLAGVPNKDIIMNIPGGFSILVPSNDEWATIIEECFGEKCKMVTRYAIKKDTKFEKTHLEDIVKELPEGYELRDIDEETYDMCLANAWSIDFVSSFDSKEHYLEKGMGKIIMKEGALVAGASSYTSYKEGIEIEVDTKEEERRKHLASVCCAALILKCLDEGKYPSWDAQNMNSVRLALRLGYEFDHEYVAYEIDN